MGEVYLARDLRLNRNVALKIISAESQKDETRKRRFVQEARAASALNHPNIVTVHDFGTNDGISYIVSELVEGESLRSLIDRGPLPMTRLLDIAIQIADGLAAAHQAGIVHRDLKPENIMIAPDGRVKILDFGLAKTILPGVEEESAGDTFSGDTFAGHGTEPGLILGTVGYMSPEQARGLPVSFASDQFSFGAILHEMTTGQKAFKGDTPMQTLLAIANVERVPFTPGPVAFRMLTERCLARDPEKRFPTTSDVAERLRKIRAQLPAKTVAQSQSGEEKPAQRRGLRLPRVSRRTGHTVAIGALGALMMFSLGMLLARYLAPAPGADLARYEFTPLAAEAAAEVLPAFAPGGKLVAYAADQDGAFQIFTRPLGSASATQLTHSPDDCLFPFWSPDRNRVYYIAKSYLSNSSLYSVGSSGGAPELLFQNVVRADISPDGKSLALVRGDTEGGPSYSLWFADRAGNLRKAPHFEKMHVLRNSLVKFSPDGKKLGLWVSRWDGPSEFWVLPLPDGNPQRPFVDLSPTSQARLFVWMPDNRRIVFSDRHLWMGDTRSGAVTKLSTGTGHEEAPAVKPDGKEIAFSSFEGSYVLTQVPAGNQAQAPAPEHFSDLAPAWSPIRDEYAYVTNRHGDPEIWLRQAKSGWERMIVGAKEFTDETIGFSDIAFSPDGQRIAFQRDAGGTKSIWIATLSGEPPEQLPPTPGKAFQSGPSWSPDGNWLAYTAIRSAHYALIKARLGSQDAPLIISETAGTNASWSPKNDWIATVLQDKGLQLSAPDGSKSRTIGTGAWLNVSWSKDGTTLSGLVRTADRRLTVSALTLATAEQRVAEDFGRIPPAFAFAEALGLDPVRGLSVSPDGKIWLTSLFHLKSDLWLLRGFQRT